MKTVKVPKRYHLVLNAPAEPAHTFAVLVHELAHLYCGHLGSSNLKHWPNRLNLSLESRECEAESVCYIVCKSLGLETRSDAYLAGYLTRPGAMPFIDLDLVIKATTLIQSMMRKSLPPRPSSADND